MHFIHHSFHLKVLRWLNTLENGTIDELENLKMSDNLSDEERIVAQSYEKVFEKKNVRSIFISKF